MTEINNQEKTHQSYLDKIYEIDHELDRRLSNYTQFTIDLVEEIREKLEESKLDTLLSLLSYNVSNALEICDKTLDDYKILQELKNILDDKN